MDVVAVVIIASVVLLVVALLAQPNDDRERSRLEREAEQLEHQRKRGCGEVLQFFANELGYVAREAVSKNLLAKAIDAGMAPGELASFIWQRCEGTDGLTLGYKSLGPDQRIPVILPASIRDRHLYIVGKSGSGKTTLVRNLLYQDFQAGHGCAVLAPEQELITDELLPFIPQSRWDDVIYVNPTDTNRPIPLNPLHLGPGEDLDLTVDETLTIFLRLFDDQGGGGAPRMEMILRSTLYTLTQIPKTTLLDIPKLLDRQNDTYRSWVVDQLADPALRTFWTTTYPAYPKDAALPLLNRLGRLLQPKVVRSILCHPEGSLDIRQAMDDGKIVLFNLSDGVLGEANAQLLGRLVVAKLQLAAMSRANVAKEKRRPFYVYVDEFQSFVGVAGTSYEKILSRARKYGLGLILAHQQTGQIPEHLMRDILGNVATLVVFNVSASDAKRLGRELVGERNGVPTPLNPQELLSLKVGQAFAKIDRTVLFLPTHRAPEHGDPKTRSAVIAKSRENYAPKPPKRPPPTGDASGASAQPPPGADATTQTATKARPKTNFDDVDPGEVF